MPERSISLHTATAEETECLGERIGRALKPGAVVALTGELGAGKTTLTKGIARGLGVTDLIHSPTFNLIHEHRGLMPVYHFDLYRLDSPEQMEDLDYESYFTGNGATVIEWSEKISGLLPDDRLEIRISEPEDGRAFELRATGPISNEVIESLRRAGNEERAEP